MWNTLPFESKVRAALIRDFGETSGQEIFGEYTSARKQVIEEIIPEIKAIEPNLTDHGPDHIADVMENVHLLIGDDESLNGISLYCLAMAVLFHDVGNINGRNQHNKKISEIYDVVRKPDERFRHEKFIILQAAEAHAGVAASGSPDTLCDLAPTHLNKSEVKLRDIAALLRFADELAEGPQRTSRYMQDTHRYDEASRIYHSYSNIANIAIDRGGSRIALTVHINVELGTNRRKNNDEIARVKELLSFAYHRAEKLDQERKFTKFYSDILSPFKETGIAIIFWVNGSPCDVHLTPIVLSDVVLPGDKNKSIDAHDSAYEIDKICTLLKKCASKQSDP